MYIDGGKVKALATGVKGKETTLKLLKGKLPAADKVKKVCVVGREEPTNAELARDAFVLRVLQGGEEMDESPFVRMMCFPPHITKKGKKGKCNGAGEEGVQVKSPLFQTLNRSQQAAVRAMVGSRESLVIAHGAYGISTVMVTRPISLGLGCIGPPGTGKTSTIAAALEYYATHREPAWVVAHSNVGVKNIAESLVKRKIDFKVIVSQDFYYEW